MLNTVPLFPGIPGGPELLIVLFVLVLLFGANKIPKLARSTGQAMGEFQRGRNEIEEELQQMEGSSSNENSESRETEPSTSTPTENQEPEPSTSSSAESRETESSTETSTETSG